MKSFDKQPIIYNTQEELVEWLEWDLYQQRLSIAQSQNITLSSTSSDDDINDFLKLKIDDKNLTLNISGKTDERTINCDFYFNNILAALNVSNDINSILDDNVDSICPYNIVANKVQFSSNVFFAGTTFLSEVSFSHSAFVMGANFSGTTFENNINLSRVSFTGEINFSRAVFEREGNFSNSSFLFGANFFGSSFEGNVYFSSSTFGSEVNFSNGVFKGNTYFTSSAFEANTNFSRSSFDGELNFSDSTFDGNTYFSSSTFGGEVNFLMSTFECGELNFSRSIFEGEVNFSSMVCKSNVNFSRSEFSGGSVDFSATTFGGNIYFSGIKFAEAVDFSRSTFSGSVDFSMSTLEGLSNFSVSTFGGNVNFSMSHFNGDINLSFSTFCNLVNFSDSTFNGEVDYSMSVFDGTVDYSMSIFNKTSIFSEVYFNQDVRFFDITLNAMSIFNNIVLNPQKSYIKFSNINYDSKNRRFIYGSRHSKIKIVNTVIKGRIEFNNVKISEIDFKDSDVAGGGIINRVNFNAEPSNWQTASLLKHEAVLRDNTIEALEYKKIEKNKHTIELCKNIANTFKNPRLLPKNIQYIPELLSLLVSKLSNNHGQNWAQAIVFTLSSAFLFFSLAYMCIHNTSIHNIGSIYTNAFFKDYFNYLIPVNIDLLRNVDENIHILFFVSYIMGKITISYGMVEVVQAFRKFNTKGN